MKRRVFLALGSALGLYVILKPKRDDDFENAFKEVSHTLTSVQAHMFPQNTKLPSAQAMRVTRFLFETMSHQSFDADIKKFVLEGAKELEKREKGNFTKLTTEEKEVALRAYEQTNYGSLWLSRIMILTMEALFSDPIYGGNVNENGWEALDAYGGLPRAVSRYAGL